MRIPGRQVLLFAVAALFGTSALHAQQADVTFFVIGKHGSYEQDVLRQVHSVDFSFFSEIF